MKKYYLITITLAAMILFSTKASAYDFTDTTSSNHVLRYTITSSSAPYTVKVVGVYQGFYDLNNEYLIIPDSVRYNGNTYLVTEIDYQAFIYANLSGVTIPNSVHILGNAAFLGSGITSVRIGSGVSKIGEVCFSETLLLSTITVDSANTHFKAVDNVLFNYNMDTLLFYPSAKLDATYSIPSTVRVIYGNDSTGEFPFDYNSYLTSVSIPSSVVSIPFGCFMNLDNLEEITVDAANTHFISHEGVLYNFAMDTALQYPQAKPSTFYDIPTTVKHIANNAFVGCPLSSITIPNSVLSIGSNAFYYAKMNNIIIGASVDTICDFALGNTEFLNNITVLSPNPPRISRYTIIAFGTTFIHKDLHVVCGSGQSYHNNPNWELYIRDSTFVQLMEDCQYHNITIDADTNFGSAATNTFSARMGDTVVISIIPNLGCYTYDWSVFKTNDPLVRMSVSNDTLIMPNYDITIGAGFAPLGITNTEVPFTKIYPNPASNVLYVETSDAIKYIEIINATGAMIMRHRAIDNTSTLNISGLPNGIYMVKIITNEGTDIRRLAIAR